MPPIFVDHLSLSHFRSHHHLQLQTQGQCVVLYGANGAGKTNILEAVSMLSPGRGLRRSSAFDMARRPESLGWKLQGRAFAHDRLHEIETWSDQGAARQIRIDGKTAPQAALGRILPILWLVPAMDRLWTEGADGRRRFLDRMTLSFHPSHAEHILGYEKAMRERNRLLKDQVQDAHWYRALEGQMAQAAVHIWQARTECIAQILAAQGQAQTAFPTVGLTLTNAAGDSAIMEADDLCSALSDNRGQDMAAGRSLIGPHRDDTLGVFEAKGVAAKDSSTGEQKAMLISLILANARALQVQRGAAPVLLLDEVAAHLDSTRRAALYAEIHSIGAQAWMTGTGADLFEELEISAQHIEVFEENGKSALNIKGVI